nr:immunoglobulin light chain junction region [Macaca mulatta]MOV72827.1 immunoglobulin light chain junction region [Macaca mulatta]MOV73825.1 immunoglobulin light chain junction region [Macaca mulatta]
DYFCYSTTSSGNHRLF